MTAYDLNQDDLLSDVTTRLDEAAVLLSLASAVMMANGFLSAGGMAVGLFVQLGAVTDMIQELVGLTELDDIEAVKVRASQQISGYLAMQKKKALEEQDSGI